MDQLPIMADETQIPNTIETPTEIESSITEPPVADAKDAEIAGLLNEVGSLKERLLRLAADMDNLRKRSEREKAEATLYAATNFARDLLSVADSLGRALAAVSPEERERADEITRNLLAGVEVTERELLNVFQRHGIRKLQTVGQKFDPHMHQALFEIPTSEFPPGTVAQEVQSGFAIGERCLRPAMVGVAKSAEQPADQG
jgi:molecular chaperone GrpE